MSATEPTPAQLKRARHAAGDSLAAAAQRVHVTRAAWTHWESGKRSMSLGSWELYLLLTDQHPTLMVQQRESVDALMPD